MTSYEEISLGSNESPSKPAINKNPTRAVKNNKQQILFTILII